VAVVDGFDPKTATQTLSKWVVGELARCGAAVDQALEEFRFNEAATALYEFVWGTLCDWYVELAKPVFSGDDEAAKTETRAVTGFVLAETVKLLHPIMPFITEELWDKLDQRAGKGELVQQAWSVLPAAIADAAADAEMGWLVKLISDIRSARNEVNVPAGAKLSLLVRDAGAETRARLDRHRAAIERLARVEGIQHDMPAPKGALQVVLGEATYALPVADVIDLKAERARLEKEIRKLDGEVTKIDAKLGNAQFMSKAPEDVVVEQRERRDDAVATTARLRQAMERLAG